MDFVLLGSILFSLIMLAGCCVASPCATHWLSHRLSLSSHCAALSLSYCTSWLSYCLSPSSRCATLLSSRRTSLLLHCLLLPSRRAAHSSSCHAGWLLPCLLTHRPLVVSLSHCTASRCLVMPAGCRIIISYYPIVALPSCPLIMLTDCCIASPTLPASLNAIFIVHCH
jgi:hypothetical protein